MHATGLGACSECATRLGVCKVHAMGLRACSKCATVLGAYNMYAMGLGACNKCATGLCACSECATRLGACNMHAMQLGVCKVHAMELRACSKCATGLGAYHMHAMGLGACSGCARGLSTPRRPRWGCEGSSWRAPSCSDAGVWLPRAGASGHFGTSVRPPGLGGGGSSGPDGLGRILHRAPYPVLGPTSPGEFPHRKHGARGDTCWRLSPSCPAATGPSRG